MAASGPPPRVSTALAHLLEREARLETMLADARERAAGIISHAEREARENAEALERELAEASAQAEGRRSADCAERLAALSRESELALARLKGLGTTGIGEMARWVVGQVLDGGPAGDMP